jgi:hypothetical protein
MPANARPDGRKRAGRCAVFGKNGSYACIDRKKKGEGFGMEHEQIAAQVKKLTGKNNDAAYAALCTLEAESEASAAVCVFWDAFAAMLDDKRTYVRMRGMVLLACNAQWAGPEQVMEMLERYLAHITDEKAAAARWCVQRLPQFAAACPGCFPRARQALLCADLSRYSESMASLLERDIRAALKRLPEK